MRWIPGCIAPAALALGLAVSPSQAALLGKGALELNPSLAFSHNSYSAGGSSDFTTTTLDVSAFVGYFTSDLVEIGGGLLVSYQSIPGIFTSRLSATHIGLTGGVTLNFATSSNVVPYLRGSVGLLDNSGDTGHETTYLAPLLEGGLRVMVGQTASVNFAAGFQHQTNAFGVQDESANIVTFGVGLSVFPKTGK